MTGRYYTYIVRNMADNASLGQFEQLVLTAVLSLGDKAYGVTIHEKVEALSHPKAAALGAVYVTLDRLEDKKLIVSKMSDPTPERGGRAKRFYRMSEKGERALKDAAATARRMCEVIETTWGDGAWKPARTR